MPRISQIGEAFGIGADFTADWLLQQNPYAEADDLAVALKNRYGTSNTFTGRVVDALLNRVKAAHDAAELLEQTGFAPRAIIPRVGSRGQTGDEVAIESAYRYKTNVTVSDGFDEQTITVIVNSDRNLTFDELVTRANQQAANVNLPGFGSMIFADIAARPDARTIVDVVSIFRAT